MPKAFCSSSLVFIQFIEPENSAQMKQYPIWALDVRKVHNARDEQTRATAGTPAKMSNFVCCRNASALKKTAYSSYLWSNRGGHKGTMESGSGTQRRFAANERGEREKLKMLRRLWNKCLPLDGHELERGFFAGTCMVKPNSKHNRGGINGAWWHLPQHHRLQSNGNASNSNNDDDSSANNNSKHPTNPELR